LAFSDILGFDLRLGYCGLSLGLEGHGFGLDVGLEGCGLDAICCLPDKCSAAYPIPTDVLKRISHQIAPFITSLFNRSLAFGRFPVSFKIASVTPALKKPGLDPTDAGSYRPTSNLSALSKLLKRLAQH